MRDFQQNRVYRWERLHVPAGPPVSIAHAQQFVNYIWSEEGLMYPPIVSQIHPNERKAAGKANREQIWFQPVVSTKTLVHEIAHSMTMNIWDPDDRANEYHGHDEKFVGVYMRLLEKFMKIPLPVLMYTADKEGVKFDIMASPVFLD